MIDADDHEAHNPVSGFDFSVVKPTVEQKNWMIDSIIQKNETAASCARKYRINRKSLHKLVRRRLKGIPVRSKTGRPRVLDEISIDSIDSQIRENSSTKVDLLRGSIQEEFINSHNRRHPNSSNGIESEADSVKISRRSLKRNLHSFQPVLPLFLNQFFHR